MIGHQMNQPTKVTNKLITSTIVENSLNSSFFFIFSYIYLYVLQIISRLFDLVFNFAIFVKKNLLLIFKLYYFDMDFSSDSYLPFHLNSKNAT